MLVSLAEQTGAKASIPRGRLETYSHQHDEHTLENDMHTPTLGLAPPIALHRPLWRRATGALWFAWQAGRARRWARRQAIVQRCLAAFACWDVREVARLDDHLLRDIGVPDWLRAEAHVLRRDDSMAALWQGVGPAEGFDTGARW